MKKFVCVLLAAVMLLAGCSESGAAETEKTSPAVVLVDDDVVKVTYVEIFETSGFCYLRLKVENKTNQQIAVYLMDAYVNDMSVMMMSGVPMDIAPGKMSQNPFIFSGFTKDEVEKIEFKVHVYDEHMGDIEETDVVTLKVK